ncbi:MAG: flagellin, partial [Eubacteriales bacterium]
EVAQNNAQDGISLIQTAEGALTEVHSMLNRMVELAEKSANGTLDDLVDRKAIQKEVNDLLSEIDRISQATNFNGINLLGGATESAGGGTTTPMDITATLTTNGDSGTSTPAVITLNFDDSQVAEGAKFEIGGYTYTFAENEGGAELATAINDNDVFSGFTATYADGKLTLTQDAAADLTTIDDSYDAVFTPADAGGGTTTPMDITATLTTNGDSGTSTPAVITLNFDDSQVAEGAKFEIGGYTHTFAENEGGAELATAINDNDVFSGFTATYADGKLTLTQDAAANLTTIDDTYDAVFTPADAGADQFALTLQIGDTDDDFQKVTIKIDDLSSDGLSIKGLDVSNQEAAGAAIAKIKDAINKVSTNRANLGGLQNRLEHTINNLSVTEENMTAAESRIRDVDMAKEMMAYTKNNVLAQAAQAMLAQANTQPQSVLQLLQ